MIIFALFTSTFALKRSYEGTQVLRGSWQSDSVSENILKFLENIEFFNLWSPDDLSEISKTKSLDVLLQNEDAEKFLSKFGEGFEQMIPNVSDHLYQPKWAPENNSTYDDFLTYKV